jgi:hypothetical protein
MRRSHGGGWAPSQPLTNDPRTATTERSERIFERKDH